MATHTTAESPNRLITEQEIATFRAQGAVLLKRLVSEDWLALMRQVAAEELAHGPDPADANYYDDGEEAGSAAVIDDIFMTNPKMWRFLTESPLAQVAAAAMGSPMARIYEDLLLYRAPVKSSPTPWHQDEPQWPVSGSHLSSIWFTLEPTTPSTGGLQFVAGSHPGPLYIPYMPAGRQDDLQTDMHYYTGGKLPDIEADPQRFPVHAFSTEPGDAILFHPRAVHAAWGNHPTRPRHSFTIRFLGQDVRWLPKASVYHDWLKAIDLPEGAPVEHERFPQLWPVAA